MLSTELSPGIVEQSIDSSWLLSLLASVILIPWCGATFAHKIPGNEIHHDFIYVIEKNYQSHKIVID